MFGLIASLGDDLLRGRQLVARLQQAQPQGIADLLDQLEVGGDTQGGVELELDQDQVVNR